MLTREWELTRWERRQASYLLCSGSDWTDAETEHLGAGGVEAEIVAREARATWQARRSRPYVDLPLARAWGSFGYRQR